MSSFDSLYSPWRKEYACNAGNLGFIPGLGRSPGGGHGTPLQYSCLENPHGQRSLVGYSPQGRKESDTTQQLSIAQNSSKSMKMYIYFHLIDEETEAWRHEIAYSKPHGMHISSDRNFYPDLDVLKTVFFSTVPVLLPIIESSKSNQISSRPMAFTWFKRLEQPCFWEASPQ